MFAAGSLNHWSLGSRLSALLPGGLFPGKDGAVLSWGCPEVAQLVEGLLSRSQQFVSVKSVPQSAG